MAAMTRSLSAPTFVLLAVLVVSGCATGDAVVVEGTGTEEQVLAAAARQEALETLPSHDALEWSAPDGGVRGRIVPLRSFRTGDGRFCREFVEEVASADAVDRFTDVRCRTAQGRWLRPRP
jgi:surface antigen